MIYNIPKTSGLPLCLMALVSIGISSAAFGQAINPQYGNSQALPGSQFPSTTLHSGTLIQQQQPPRVQTGPPSNNPPGFNVTVHPTNPVVNYGPQNPMYRQPTWPSPWNYVYPNSNGSLGYTTANSNAPTYIGGYYYGDYCSTPYYPSTYPSIYSVYSGEPQYICDPDSIDFAPPYVTGYTTTYLPFYSQDEQDSSQPTMVTYNQNSYTTNNYYAPPAASPADPQPDSTPPAAVDPSTPAKHAAFDAGSYKAAFVDIENAWVDGNMDLISSHLRDSDTKISVSLNGKYAYSINSADFGKITKDAFSSLNTVAFEFTRLRTAKNGDITAYGTHTYLAVTQASTQSDSSKGSDGNTTVPFDAPDSSSAKSTDGSVVSKKVYVSFTLRQGDSQWYVVAVDSSTSPLVPDQD